MLNAFCRLLEVAAAQQPAGARRSRRSPWRCRPTARRRSSCSRSSGRRSGGRPGAAAEPSAPDVQSATCTPCPRSPCRRPSSPRSASGPATRWSPGSRSGAPGTSPRSTSGRSSPHELLGSQALAGAPGRDRRPRGGARRGAPVGAHGAPRAGAPASSRATRSASSARSSPRPRSLTRSFPLLLLGTMLIGFGNASNNLSRYTAADMVKTDRRASAIGTVVWAATVGLGRRAHARPGRRASSRSGPGCRRWPARTSCRSCSSASRRSSRSCSCGPTRTSSPTRTRSRSRCRATRRRERVWSIMRRPGVFAAIVALVVGQTVMVLIMTMTPLHMTAHGHSLGEVGHRAVRRTRSGMFALSPLSGRLTDRFGTVPTIFLGAGDARRRRAHGRGRPARRRADPARSRCSCSAWAGTSGSSRAPRSCRSTSSSTSGRGSRARPTR